MKPAFFLVLLGCAVCAGPQAHGRDVPSERPSSGTLEQIEKKMETQRDARAHYRQRARDAQREVFEIRKKMVNVAGKLQTFEQELSPLKGRLAALKKEEEKLSRGLDHRHKQMVSVLAALQNLAWHPTEAVLMRPGSPVRAIRTAIVLLSTVPGLEDAAARLRRDLKTMKSLKAAIRSQHVQISHLTEKIGEKHATLQTLFKKKAEIQESFEKKSREAEQGVMQLAKKAKNLKDLSQRQEAEKERRIRVEGQRLAGLITDQPERTLPPRPATPPKRTPQPPQTDIPESIDARPFAEARGSLPLPVGGEIVRTYGTRTESGAHARGLTIRSRAGAHVIAPYDGVVLFSGPFRGYGHLLIIEHGDGYHTLLAGMARSEADVGQTLLAGEPVGRMADEDSPDLYVELRRNGKPINPMPWLAAQKSKESG